MSTASGQSGSLYLKTGTSLNNAMHIPSADGTWTKFTSNVEATLALACEDAGYIDFDMPKLASGVVTFAALRIPVFTQT